MPFIEHRASERRQCDTPVIIENCQTGEHCDGSLYNYSRCGMYLEIDIPLKPETEIRIVVEKSGNYSHPDSCQAKVIWCKEVPGAVVLYNYGIGVKHDSKIQLAGCVRNFRIIEGGAAKKSL